MPFPHGFATNGGLSSGGGAHSADDDLFSGRLIAPDADGGSRSREFTSRPDIYAADTDDPGYSRSRSSDGYSQKSDDSDDGGAPSVTPNSVGKDTDPYPAIEQSASDKVAYETTMPTYKGHVGSDGTPQTELNELWNTPNVGDMDYGYGNPQKNSILSI